MASLLKCSSSGGSVLFDSLMEMAGSVADVRGTFRLEYEFSKLSKRIGFKELNLRNCTCSKRNLNVVLVVLVLQSKGP